MDNGENRFPIRYEWLDVLKGLGSFLVVIGHIYSNDMVYKWIYSFHIPLFFFAGGYVYKKKSISDDIKRRIRTIIIPYYFFGIINFLYWLVIERRFRPTSLSIGESLVGLVFGEFELLEFNVHLWFLPAFFVTSVTYNIINQIDKKRLRYVVVLMLSLVTVLKPVIGFSVPQLPWELNKILIYIGFYCLGNIAKEYRIFDKFRIFIRTYWLLLFGIISYCIGFFMANTFKDVGIMWYIIGSIGILGSCCTSLLLEKKTRYVPSVLKGIGKASLIILIFHGPIYRILIKAFSIVAKTNTENIRASLGLSVLITGITILLCYIIHKIILKYFPYIIGRK